MPMNNVPGQGPPVPGRMGFPTGRNIVPPGLNYHGGVNSGPSGPGGYGGGFSSYPGVFPQKPGQEEDQMTSNNVKTGYMDKGIIQNETVSAQGILADGLQDPKKLHDLGAFMVEVLKKRQESSKITGPSTFRPPSRATLNDQKKEQWMADLSGTVSLRRLSRSVPHGFKSEKLLETLAQRQVPMMRATWYIKIVALSEMQAQRSRPSSTQNQYSTDWTLTVNMFLKKQLLEINPHSVVKPAASALNPASGAQNVKPWSSEEAKEKWEAKWRYSVMLTKWQYNEGLLDHRHFLRATVEQLSSLGFEQVALLLSLISMFLSEYARSRLLMRLLIEGLLSTLQSVQRHPSYNQPVFRYAYLELELKRMLQSIFLSTPDMFVIPKAWATHSTLLQQVLLHDIQSVSHKPTVFPNVESVLEANYKMIRARVQVFTDLNSSGADNASKTGRLGSNVDILDKVDHTSDMEQVAHEYFAEGTESYSCSSIPPSPSKSVFSPTSAYFVRPEAPSPSSSQRLEGAWRSRVNTLCEWAITNSRYGHHRIYLAGTLLGIWRESPVLSPRVPLHERTSRLQGALLEFLDSFNGTHLQPTHHLDLNHGHHQQHSTHGSEDTLEAIARLFGNLIHDRLFSYQQYLQRLIARGDLQPSKRGQESTLRHLKYLQSFPLHKDAQAHHLNQRRVVLYGVNGEDEYDRECFETITAQIKSKLPHMFSSEAANITVPIKDSPQDGQELAIPLSVQYMELILSASRFCQLRVTSQWLLNAVKSYVVKHIQIGEDNWRVMTSPGSSLLNVRQFATVVNVMEVASDFHSLYDTCIWLLDHTSDKALLTYVVNVAKKHCMVWTAMGVLTKFSQAILAKHYSLQSKNVIYKSLPRYLALEAHNVPEDIRAQMEADLVTSKISTSTGATIPAQLQELQSLPKDPSPTAVSNMASSLHFKYGGLAHWPLRLFDGCIDALRKLDAAVKSSSAGLDNAMNGTGFSSATATQEIVRISRLYAELLVEMAERVGNGCMNEVVLSWLRLHDVDWMISVLGASTHGDEEAGDESQPIWFLSFMVQLVIQGFCSIEVLVQDMCGATLTKLASTIQQPLSHMDTHGDQLDEMQQQHQHQNVPDESTLRLCMTIVVLLRLLLLEDAFSDPRASHAYGASHHGLSLEHHTHRLGIQLTIAEIHALQTQRYSRLMAMQQQLRNEQNSESEGISSFTSSLMEQQMMLVQFQICRDLVWVESCLPLNHKVLHEIHEYRKDWALSADWLRERCLSNVDGAYKMFLQTRQDQSQAGAIGSRMPGDSKSIGTNTQDNKKHLEVVDRKMMETFQMLVAESHDGLMLLDTYGDAALTPSMIQQRTFRSIFSRVDRWMFDRCKIEFWLLLDNVMIERATREKRTVGDRNSKDGTAQGSTPSSGAASITSDGLMMMEGVTMTLGTGASSQVTNSMGLSDTGVDGGGNGAAGDSLQQLIHIFFQEFVLSETVDKELLGRMLVGMRSDAVEEFIRYGYGILAGNPNVFFPYNVMILQRPVSSADYVQIASNFHYVMEILMKEGQPPLSLVTEELLSSQTSAASATPLASTPSSSQPTNTNNNMTASVLQGLDAIQLENRIEFAKSLLWQLKKFEDRIRYFDVMHAIGCSYEEASKVVQDSESGGRDMEDLLLNASLQRHHFTQSHPHLMNESTAPYQQQQFQSSGDPPIQLVDLRTSLCLRLRLLVPLLPVILQHPSSTACDLTTYVIRLTNLLVSSIIHGQGSEERLFEFCLDMVSCLMDEVLLLSGGLSGGGADSKAMRNDILNQLRTGLPQMTSSIPTVFASRIFRILPFQQHNVYFTGLRTSGDPGTKGAKEIQPRPWDWLEDCVGDVDQNPHQQLHQHQQPSQSPALGLGLSDSGLSTSTGLVNGDSSGTAGSSSSLSGPSLSTSSSSANDNANDTSISLTLFGAKQIRRPTDRTTYETQFKLGHGGGDDEQELILVEEQRRPCEYDHSHQQQLLMLHHQQKQEQLMMQQLQLHQQQQQKQQAEVLMGTDTGLSTAMSSGGSAGNMMDMDLFGPDSSERIAQSRSVSSLSRQQEPDPELEEGQILNDEDLDVNSMAWDSSLNSGSNNIPIQPIQQTADTVATAIVIEDGEVVEKKEENQSSDAGDLLKAGIASVAAVTPLAVPATSTPAAPVTTAAVTASSKKKTAATTATKPAKGVVATTKTSRGGKTNRAGKGIKATQATAEATASTTMTTTPASSVSSAMSATTAADMVAPLIQPMATSASLPQVSQQSQQITGLPFQTQQQSQQFHPFPPQGLQNQMRTVGGMQQPIPMSIAFPPQGQPGGPGVLTSHQLMNIMRQNQNAAMAAAAAAAANNPNGGPGMGNMTSTTTIGGIHVPFLNGQQHQQQQTAQQAQQNQQNQFMDPSAFLNNGNNGGLGFGPGNPMNIHLGHLNNNNNNSGGGGNGGNNGNNGNTGSNGAGW
ncbi:RNA polymerase II mediator complex subunit [Gamsiella multidivaricata]|nr:RNA polymerase II mediator complex subunit [Gamsiella multidivaricata]